MSKTFANTKLFAAATILFAVATLFNANMNASSPSKGNFSLRNIAPKTAAPTLEVGPTIPPNPWEDDAPSVVKSSSAKL